MGLPAKIERLEVCDITGYSIVFYFFAENPKLFGAAADTFKIDWCGAGTVSHYYVDILLYCILLHALLIV